MNIYMIINYNDYDTTKELVDSIHKYKCIDKLLVIDNCSSNNSFEKLKNLKYTIKNIIILKTDNNNGYSSAINFGIKYILDKYKDAKVAISNPDIIVSSENDLKILFERLDNKNVGVLAPSTVEDNKLNRGWKLPTIYQDILENIILLNRFFKKRKLYKDSHYNKDINKVDVVAGSIFFVKASTINKIGFLDENVFLYYEENILSKKILKEGLDIVICNDIVFIHNHSVSINKSVSRLNKYKILKESQYYYEKVYNNSNGFLLFILNLTSKITYYLLYIYYNICDIFKR